MSRASFSSWGLAERITAFPSATRYFPLGRAGLGEQVELIPADRQRANSYKEWFSDGSHASFIAWHLEYESALSTEVLSSTDRVTHLAGTPTRQPTPVDRLIRANPKEWPYLVAVITSLSCPT